MVDVKGIENARTVMAERVDRDYYIVVGYVRRARYVFSWNVHIRHCSAPSLLCSVIALLRHNAGAKPEENPSIT